MKHAHTTAVNKTNAELKSGLSNFVEAYQAARSRGAVREAIQIRNRIDKVISEKGLDRATVYGPDPDRASVECRYAPLPTTKRRKQR